MADKNYSHRVQLPIDGKTTFAEAAVLLYQLKTWCRINYNPNTYQIAWKTHYKNNTRQFDISIRFRHLEDAVLFELTHGR